MVATFAPTIADISHSLDTFRYAAALKPAPRLLEGTFSSKSPSTPMAWSVPRLSAWIESQSKGHVQLIDLVLNETTLDFKPPPWKYLYELPEKDWCDRCVTLSPTKIKELRLQYKSLFLKKRPSTRSTEVTSSYPIETIMLIEKEKTVVKKDRNQEAIDKLAAKGAALRLQASKRK
jgi:hypothetical protein